LKLPQALLVLLALANFSILASDRWVETQLTSALLLLR